ncbi:hypothetical protein PRIC1_007189 [Phytophthora ramorum]
MKRSQEDDDADESLQRSQRQKTDSDELLNAVIRLKHTTEKTMLCVETLVGNFSSFVGMVEAVMVDKHLCARVDPLVDDRIVPASVFAVHEVEALREVVRRLESSEDDIHKRGDVWYGPWLPKYGCAVQRTMVNAAELKLEVVFIDGWERALHFLQTGKCVHSAVPKIYNVLHCADLDPALEGEFRKAFDIKLRKAQEAKGSKPSAATNNLEHEKTPQFIAAAHCE